jgi:hypothetical protein
MSAATQTDVRQFGNAVIAAQAFGTMPIFASAE